MRMKWMLAAGMLLLAGCGESETKQNEEKPAEVEAKTEEAPVEEKAAAEETKATIDTSVFQYAKETEVTDAININQHVTVFVAMSEDTAPGMAVKHVVQQTYDFLQQPDIEGAKTVTIAVTQADEKIAMYTVQKDKFVPNTEKPMIDLVMTASEIEFMTPEVKEFGSTLGNW